MPFPAAVLAAALDSWLVERVTLTAPTGSHASATQTVQATGVPCRRELVTGSLVAAMAPFSGGVTDQQRWRFWFRRGTTIGALWTITDATSGARWQVQTEDLSTSEPAFVVVEAEAVG